MLKIEQNQIHSAHYFWTSLDQMYSIDLFSQKVGGRYFSIKPAVLFGNTFFQAIER